MIYIWQTPVLVMENVYTDTQSWIGVLVSLIFPVKIQIFLHSPSTLIIDIMIIKCNYSYATYSRDLSIPKMAAAKKKQRKMKMDTYRTSPCLYSSNYSPIPHTCNTFWNSSGKTRENSNMMKYLVESGIRFQGIDQGILIINHWSPQTNLEISLFPVYVNGLRKSNPSSL